MQVQETNKSSFAMSPFPVDCISKLKLVEQKMTPCFSKSDQMIMTRSPASKEKPQSRGGDELNSGKKLLNELVAISSTVTVAGV